MCNDNNTYLLTDKTSNVFIEFQHLWYLNKYFSSRTKNIVPTFLTKKKILKYIFRKKEIS